jgi:2-polyprenyl-3-methyl-5-hydroxy-6-metoxy-1,4-benzoquinol methylase
MANKKGKKIDKTFLSLDNARERGFLHRDYLAHCCRWSHVVKRLLKGKFFQTAKILDVGCGKELPLLRTMYSSKVHPHKETEALYVGVDAGPITYLSDSLSNSCNMVIEPNHQFNGLDETIWDEKEFNLVVSFEVMEHMEPAQTLNVLKGMHRVLADDGFVLVSTPCYDEKVGAADNHVNEMSFEAFGAMLQEAGFFVKKIWGTFASQKDYASKMTDGEREVFEILSEYYDTNVLSIIMAPLYPENSRNCIWECVKNEPKDCYEFDKLICFEGKEHSSSQEWVEFIKCLKIN